MAHPTRGYTSHTYDITEVLDVDLDALTITYLDAAHASPRQMRLKTDATPAARQLMEAIADSISVYGSGQWESALVLDRFATRAVKVLEALRAQGITDLSDSAVTLSVLRGVIEQFDTSLKRTLNKLLARVLVKHNPEGSALARALKNTSYMVVESRVDLYDDVEVAAIKTAARAVFDQAYKAQRKIFRALGYDVSGRGWLRVAAHEVLGSARERHGALEGALQPRLSSAWIEQLDWALLNPAMFGVAPGRPKLQVVGAALAEVGDALYPGAAVLTAALILQCLAELSGLNLSVMLRTEPNDLIYTGEENGLLTLAKARNHSEDTLPVRINSNATLGGLVEAMSGLTRFSRHFRAVHLVQGDQVPPVVNRIYVEHRRDPRRAEVITYNRLHHGWRAQIFDQHWPDRGLDREAVGLRFQALRRKALMDAVTSDPRGDVHGHSTRTRVHYLANVLPDHVLVHHATAAQDAIVERALDRFASVETAEEGSGRQLADAIAKGQTADVVVGVCTSGGNDPHESDRPCSLGLAACFTCPNGYRTVDHVPGLVATVRFTELIRDNDPTEWEEGDASDLHFYATETLRQFPQPLVNAMQSMPGLAGRLLTIEALYTEFRR